MGEGLRGGRGKREGHGAEYTEIEGEEEGRGKREREEGEGGRPDAHLCALLSVMILGGIQATFAHRHTRSGTTVNHNRQTLATILTRPLYTQPYLDTQLSPSPCDADLLLSAATWGPTCSASHFFGPAGTAGTMMRLNADRLAAHTRSSLAWR